MYLIGEIGIVCILKSTELLQIILDFKPVKNCTDIEATLAKHIKVVGMYNQEGNLAVLTYWKVLLKSVEIFLKY